MLLGTVYLVLGFMFAVISFATWKFKWLGIIAGYDEKKVVDKKRLAAWFGKCALTLSICSLALSITCFYVQPFNNNTAFVFGISFTMIIMLGTVITLSGMSKYYKF
jgi:hypothetical protein